MNIIFSEQEKKTLLSFVKETIASNLSSTTPPQLTITNDVLNEKTGIFVTLYGPAKKLRGCIGYVYGLKPLKEALGEMALAAAFEDSRFLPITQEEIKSLSVEISILSPMERCLDVNKIEIGKHGLLIKQGYNSGLLLPQVAVEWQWNRAEFLAGVCQKAGLPKEAWQTAELYIFSAEIINE